PFELPSIERLVVWFGAGIGGFAVLVAALFALVAVIEKGWIGPSARISAALVGGIALWVGGSVARRAWPWVGSAITGAGIGTLYGAAYAGSGLYALFSPTVASGLMIAVTAVATLRATVDGDRFVAWLALIGGFLTPWLISTGENHPYGLFLYLTLLSFGVVGSARARGWPDLIAGAAAGSAVLHLGWASTWYAGSQVPAALFGAALLTAPLVFAAASRGSARVAGAVTASLMPLVALPWVVPVQASFSDPRSGLWTTRSEPMALPMAALAVAALPLLPALAARRHRDPVQALVALVPAAALALVAAAGHLANGQTPTGWAAVGPIGLAVGAALLAAADRGTSRGLAWVVPIAGVALTVASPSIPSGVYSGALLGLCAAGVALGTSARDGWTPWAVLAGVALPTLAALGEESVQAVAGPALVLFAVGVLWPAWTRWERGAELAWSASPAAAIALFPVLYAVWLDRLGDSAIGALPLGLSAYVLLAGVVLGRRGALTAEGLPTAVFALVVLLGITAAVPLQLRDRWLTVAWALEAAALAFFADRIRHPLVRWTAVALCAAVGVRLLFNPYALTWGSASDGWIVLNWTLYSWGVPLVCVLLVARWLPGADRWLAMVRLPLVVLAALIGFALVNVEVSHAFQPDGPIELWGTSRLQSMVRSTSWALYGLAVLGIGLAADQRVVRLVGFAFVVLATFKVFGFDLWGLRGFVRVGSLACLGVSLLLAAVAFERLVLRSTKRAGDRPQEVS
ncbi:MAG: DUF2339 domain-containing protein, partial [Myxococcota bacterium]